MITPQLTEQYGQVLRVSLVRAIFSVFACAYAGAASNPNADTAAPAAAERRNVRREIDMSSHPCEIQFDLPVSPLDRPRVERDAGHFVDEGYRQAEFTEIDRLEIVPARLARIDPEMRKLVRLVVAEPPLVLLAAGDADDATVGPAVETVGALQLSAAASERFGVLLENRQLGRARAERTPPGVAQSGAPYPPVAQVVTMARRHAPLRQALQIRLDEHLPEEAAIVRLVPDRQLDLLAGRCGPKLLGALAKRRRSFADGRRQQRRRELHLGCRVGADLAGERPVPKRIVDVLLDAEHVHEEREHRLSRSALAGQPLCPPDAVVPRIAHADAFCTRIRAARTAGQGGPDGRAPMRVIAAAAAALVLALTRLAPLQSTPAAALRLPADLDSYITKYVKLTPAQRADLLAGRSATKLLDTDPSKEVAVFGAMWVGAPMTSYVAAVRDIERLESGENFIVTRKISSPPVIDDFARLRVPDDDAEDLR